MSSDSTSSCRLRLLLLLLTSISLLYVPVMRHATLASCSRALQLNRCLRLCRFMNVDHGCHNDKCASVRQDNSATSFYSGGMGD